MVLLKQQPKFQTDCRGLERRFWQRWCRGLIVASLAAAPSASRGAVDCSISLDWLFAETDDTVIDTVRYVPRQASADEWARLMSLRPRAPNKDCWSFRTFTKINGEMIAGRVVDVGEAAGHQLVVVRDYVTERDHIIRTTDLDLTMENGEFSRIFLGPPELLGYRRGTNGDAVVLVSRRQSGGVFVERPGYIIKIRDNGDIKFREFGDTREYYINWESRQLNRTRLVDPIAYFPDEKFKGFVGSLMTPEYLAKMRAALTASNFLLTTPAITPAVLKGVADQMHIIARGEAIYSGDNMVYERPNHRAILQAVMPRIDSTVTLILSGRIPVTGITNPDHLPSNLPVRGMHIYPAVETARDLYLQSLATSLQGYKQKVAEMDAALAAGNVDQFFEKQLEALGLLSDFTHTWANFRPYKNKTNFALGMIITNNMLRLARLLPVYGGVLDFIAHNASPADFRKLFIKYVQGLIDLANVREFVPMYRYVDPAFVP